MSTALNLWRDLLRKLTQPEMDTNFTNLRTTADAAAAAVALIAAGAPLVSPAFTGTPTAPTATAGTNTTQLATTAFAKALGDTKSPLAGPGSGQAFATGALAATRVIIGTEVVDALMPMQLNAAAGSQAYLGVNNNGAYGFMVGYDNANGYARIRNVSNTALTFETNNTERGRFSNSGKLFTGGSVINQIYTSAAIQGYGPGFAVGSVFCTDSPTVPALAIGNSAASGTVPLQEFYSGASFGLLRGSITYNGSVMVYGGTSDGTLKNILGDATRSVSLDILKNTRLRDWAWKDDEAQKVQIGVIAQEQYEIFSGSVQVGGDYTEDIEDAEGNKTTVTKYRPWTVDKTAYQWHLVAGWQDHETTITAQSATIVTLEARISALEAKQPAS